MNEELDSGAKRPPTDPLRRVLIKTGGSLALTAMVPLSSGCQPGGGRDAVGALPQPEPSAVPQPSPGATAPARYLDEQQRATLVALVDRFIPGQPEDLDPGAVAAGCAEAIDHLLAAFQTDPPFIYAGAPFSDRGGQSRNDFLQFVPLDDYEALAWRLAIEGSQGRPDLEFNGPVQGMQSLYTEGLAQLNQRAQDFGFADFAAMPAPSADLLLQDNSDARIQNLIDVAFPDTLDAMYGPPEYGGNRDLIGWSVNGFDGDTQPRGYSDEAVINADNPGLFDALLPPSYGSPRPGIEGFRSGRPAAEPQLSVVGALAALSSSETMAGVMMASDGSLRRLRARLRPLAQQRRASWQGAGHA